MSEGRCPRCGRGTSDHTLEQARICVAVLMDRDVREGITPAWTIKSY